MLVGNVVNFLLLAHLLHLIHFHKLYTPTPTSTRTSIITMAQSSVVKNTQTKFDAFAGLISTSFEASPVQSFLIAVCVFIFSVAATTWLLVGAFDRLIPQDPSIGIGKDGNTEREKARDSDGHGRQ